MPFSFLSDNDLGSARRSVYIIFITSLFIAFYSITEISIPKFFSTSQGSGAQVLTVKTADLAIILLFTLYLLLVRIHNLRRSQRSLWVIDTIDEANQKTEAVEILQESAREAAMAAEKLNSIDTSSRTQILRQESENKARRRLKAILNDITNDLEYVYHIARERRSTVEKVFNETRGDDDINDPRIMSASEVLIWFEDFQKNAKVIEDAAKKISPAY